MLHTTQWGHTIRGSTIIIILGGHTHKGTHTWVAIMGWAQIINMIYIIIQKEFSIYVLLLEII